MNRRALCDDRATMGLCAAELVKIFLSFPDGCLWESIR
jgi:hypothetical protein